MSAGRERQQFLYGELQSVVVERHGGHPCSCRCRAQGGNVGLTNLNAPSTDFLLNLGSGNASGQVNVGNLVVLGTGGQVNFTNSTVQGFTGSAAALAAQSIPPANPAYLLEWLRDRRRLHVLPSTDQTLELL